MKTNKKDTYRNYAIWIVLLAFYGVFYFINNHAWVDEIQVSTQNLAALTSSASESVYSKKQDTIRLDSSQQDSMPKNITRNQSPTSPPSKPYEVNKSEYTSNYPPRTRTPIEINSASDEEWLSLRNIGPYRAERIINFRNALGGFYSIDQVGETYAVPDSVFREIKPQLYLDSTWDMIPINDIVYDSLYLHPYITKQMAYFIVRHREKEQPIGNMKDLYDLIQKKDHERLRKLEPYLDFGIK